MNFNWKNSTGAFALSLAILGVTATGPANAKDKSENAATTSAPAKSKKASAARVKVKDSPVDCLSYTIDKRGKRVCSKTKIDSPK